jgi:hypothetical protein
LALSSIVFAQTENDLEIFEIKLSDFYSIKLKQIPESAYIAQIKTTEQLRHKPYKVITDIAEAQKILGRRLRVLEIKTENADYSNRIYEITFKNGTKKRLDEEGFVAYFPDLEILLFEEGHGSDQLFDLNNSNNAVTFSEGYPYHIRIGNPYYHSISPDKQLRINGFFDGQDCVVWFLEKWNKSNKKYEVVGWFYHLADLPYNIFDFCYTADWFWISNNKVLFKSGWSDNDNYYEIEFNNKNDK